jgi:hypothetical protein
VENMKESKEIRKKRKYNWSPQKILSKLERKVGVLDH